MGDTVRRVRDRRVDTLPPYAHAVNMDRTQNTPPPARPDAPPAPDATDRSAAALAQLKAKLKANRRLAHQFLFPHRHPQATPAFHYEMIDRWHSDVPLIADMAFRGAAKSTIAEEAILIQALFGEFFNGVVIGDSEGRAAERITAIKSEIETNDRIHQIFGDMKGKVWGATKCELRNGTYLQAMGRDQGMRGVKWKDRRPDRLFVDDYEDDESVATPEARTKTRRRFFSVVLPAMDPAYKARVAGTPLDNDALMMQFVRSRDWDSKVYPIKYIDPDTQEWRATWESRFPLEDISKLERLYASTGESLTFVREYMCQPEDPSQKLFSRAQFPIQQLTHTWEPCYAIYDPARTTDVKTSAMTGKVVVSWIGNRIIVWESAGMFWKPDEIVQDLFETDAKYKPLAIGIEKNGLHEFLMQPIRQAQVNRGHPLPIRELMAPKGKLDFIKGLQPFARAGEIILNGEQTELLNQVEGYPTGRNDILNALAYILKLRFAQPMYPSFGYANVSAEIVRHPTAPWWLAVNATAGTTTAVLLQVVEGALRVHADWVSEEAPGEVLAEFMRMAQLEAGKVPRLIAPLDHFGGYDVLGLWPAAKKIPVELMKGGELTKGREEIRDLIEKSPKGRPGLQVNYEASWTLRAMTGGYCKKLDRVGVVQEEAEENAYKTLMEGLEAMMALTRLHNEGDSRGRLEYTDDGRAYISARVVPNRR